MFSSLLLLLIILLTNIDSSFFIPTGTLKFSNEKLFENDNTDHDNKNPNTKIYWSKALKIMPDWNIKPFENGKTVVKDVICLENHLLVISSKYGIFYIYIYM